MQITAPFSINTPSRTAITASRPMELNLNKALTFGNTAQATQTPLEETKEISQRGWGSAFKEGVKAMGPFFTDWKLTGQAFQVIVAGAVFGAIGAVGTPVAIVTIPMSIASLAAIYLAFDFVHGFGREREMQNEARKILAENAPKS